MNSKTKRNTKCNAKRSSLCRESLRPIHKYILKFLKDDVPASVISKRLNKCHSTISVHIKNLKASGFLREETGSRPGQIKLYRLTKLGIETLRFFLAPYEKRDLEIRSHAIIFKTPIVNGPRKEIDTTKWKFLPLKNNPGYGKHFHGIWVAIYPKNVIFEFPPIVCKNTFEGLSKCKDEAVKIMGELEAELPGLRLGTPECISELVRQEHAFKNDEFAKWCCSQRPKISLDDGRVMVDASYGPELEFKDKRTAAEDAMTYKDFVHDVLDDKFNHKREAQVHRELLASVKVMAENAERVQTAQEINAKQIGTILSLLKPPESVRKVPEKKQEFVGGMSYG